MKHPLVELTKMVSGEMASAAWEDDPIASKQKIKTLVQAIKTKAARAGIHKVNNAMNIKVPIPAAAIERAAKSVLADAESYEMGEEKVSGMVEEFMAHIDRDKRMDSPDRVVKVSSGHMLKRQAEHPFNNSLGTSKPSSEPVVTLLDYCRALYQVANKFHTQIAA